jgi:zinc finger HIT domain-containing protein 1
MSSQIAPVSSKRLVREAARPRVLDAATRQRRARKALESLEQDNFHDDPHADLVMSKKALNLFQEGDDEDAATSAARKSKKKTRSKEYYRQRFRKNFSQLLEEDAVLNADPPNYLSAQAAPSTKALRNFCAVCGFKSCYTCVTCGARYCSLRCQETHQETRCLKFTA